MKREWSIQFKIKEIDKRGKKTRNKSQADEEIITSTKYLKNKSIVHIKHKVCKSKCNKIIINKLKKYERYLLI